MYFRIGLANRQQFHIEWVRRAARVMGTCFDDPIGGGYQREDKVLECVCGEAIIVPAYGDVECPCGAWAAWYWDMYSDRWVALGFCTLSGQLSVFSPVVAK